MFLPQQQIAKSSILLGAQQKCSLQYRFGISNSCNFGPNQERCVNLTQKLPRIRDDDRNAPILFGMLQFHALRCTLR